MAPNRDCWWLLGFEGQSTLWEPLVVVSGGTAGAVSSIQKRTGTYSYRINITNAQDSENWRGGTAAGNAQTSYSITHDGAKIGRVWIYGSTYPSAGERIIVALVDDGYGGTPTDGVYVTVDANRYVRIRKHDGTLIAGPSAALPASQWNKIELLAQVGTGSDDDIAKVRINSDNTSILDGSGPSVFTTAYGCRYPRWGVWTKTGGSWPAGKAAADIYFDDVRFDRAVYNDLGWMTDGGVVLTTIAPNSDISVSSWTPVPSSPTTRYDKIDERVPANSGGSDDYIYPTTVLAACQFSCTGISLAPGVVDAIFMFWLRDTPAGGQYSYLHLDVAATTRTPLFGDPTSAWQGCGFHQHDNGSVISDSDLLSVAVGGQTGGNSGSSTKWRSVAITADVGPEPYQHDIWCTGVLADYAETMDAADTYVDEGAATSVFGSQDFIYIGYYVGAGKSPPTYMRHGIIRKTLSGIPSDIEYAGLSLFKWEAGTHDIQNSRIYDPLSHGDWTEAQCSWLYRNANAWQSSGGDVTSPWDDYISPGSEMEQWTHTPIKTLLGDARDNRSGKLDVRVSRIGGTTITMTFASREETIACLRPIVWSVPSGIIVAAVAGYEHMAGQVI